MMNPQKDQLEAIQQLIKTENGYWDNLSGVSNLCLARTVEYGRPEQQSR